MTYQLLQGDCIEVLKVLPAQSVHCVITSPPYFGLRDYGHAGQIGLEQTPAEYVAKLVQVFREVWRVLRDDGTVWLNLGDSYAANRGYQVPDNKWGDVGNNHGSTVPAGLKPKDLIGIPWRVAFALQDDGWYLRSDIIWHKPNPMPESVTDRPTKAHEYLFLLAKRERYYYDAQAIAEPSITNDMRRPYGSEGAWQLDGRPAEQRHGGELRANRAKTFARNNAVSEHVLPGQSAAQHRPDRTDVIARATRNRRSVWTVATKPFSEAHFATYPVELVQPCIMAGTSGHGCCSACGAPWVRVVETVKSWREGIYDDDDRQSYMAGSGNRMARVHSGNFSQSEYTTTGWSPSCTCAADVVPCTVLDTFSGAATTGVAAIGLGRHYIGIELNPDYLAMADRRLRNTQPALIAAD